MRTKKFYKDLTGKQFGYLTVLNYMKTEKNGHTVWACKCKCGKTKNVLSGSLLSNKTKSCGCYGMSFEDSSINLVFGKYQRAAMSRGYCFSLSRDDFISIIKKDCHYCGSSPKNKASVGDKNIVYNGIDRIDNSIGYTIENVVPCCIMCNKGKNKYSEEEFLCWIERVYEKSIKGKHAKL